MNNQGQVEHLEKDNPKSGSIRLGGDIRDNTRWIKENRFLLESVGNEKISCRRQIWSTNVDVINCLAQDAVNPMFIVYCDNFWRPISSKTGK